MTESSPPPAIALVIFRLAPAGGLEQHCLRLAEILVARGAAVTLMTTRAPATPLPYGVSLHFIPERGRTNHGRIAAFAEDALDAVATGFDRTVAFHAIPGFDLVFCADPSRASPGPLRSLLPRYRTFARLERLAFAPPSRTRILCLSAHQRDAIAAADDVPPQRLFLLPPTVDLRRADAKLATTAAKARARKRLKLASGDVVWLWMGLQAKTKGLDRALLALAGEPSGHLLVSGLDPDGGAGAEMLRLASRLRVSGRVTWLGFASEAEIKDAIAAADLLIHPSRADVTGTVILEALGSGLPVITTAVCGYGEHVVAAGAGIVLPEPFRPEALARAVADASQVRLRGWSAAALAYMRREDLFSGLAWAADLILEGPDASG